MRLQNNIQELQSVFDGIRHQSADGSEYWNSRELSDALGYSGYWKFRTVIEPFPMKDLKPMCLIHLFMNRNYVRESPYGTT